MADLESNPLSFLLNFEARKKQILLSVGAVLAGTGILIAYFLSAPDPVAFAKAKMAYVKWETSPEDTALFGEMKDALRKAPTLEKKYESAIAQKLIDTEKLEDAMQLAARSFQRVAGEAPFHTDYAQTSLLIERKEYQQALERAVGLKEQMQRSFDTTQFLGDRLVGGGLLYVHNLLRIACLHQELNNRPGEKVAWEELEAFLRSETPLSGLVLGSFSEKQLDLAQYIFERKKQL